MTSEEVKSKNRQPSVEDCRFLEAPPGLEALRALGRAERVRRRGRFTVGSIISSKKNQPYGLVFLLEAPPGLEPGNRGFAVRCLTTWLWRRVYKTVAGANQNTRD